VAKRLGRGSVVLVGLPTATPPGHEQEGLRPAVLIGLPEEVGTPRFPLVTVLPVTRYRQQVWARRSPVLYPVLPAGAGGLRGESVVLLDQIRTVDATRVRRYLGDLTADQMVPIQRGLRQLLDL